MSALADQQPKRIADMFKNSKKAASGIYAVDLYNLGVPRTVVVDDYLAFRPRYTVGSQPRVKLNEKELDKDEYPQTHIWPPILEKAVAKMLGNYFHIEGGSTGQGLGLLTGAPYVKHLHPDVVKAGKGKGGTEDLWKDIVRYLKAGHFVTTGTSGHAYSVLSAQEVGGKRYMVVRNPWGHEDKETFGYKDDALAKQLGKAKLEDYELNVNDGQFVMDWETEYLVKFVDTYLSLDTTLWAYDSFLRLDDKTKSSERPGIREGICGKKCLRYEFTLSSTKDQNVYVNMWVWPKAAYIRHPPAKPKGPSIIDYDDKQVVFLEYITGNTINIAQVNVQTGATAMKEPLKMKAGESTKIAIEFDAEGSSNFKDWSVTAWGDEGGDSIKVTPNDKSLKSDKWPEIK